MNKKLDNENLIRSYEKDIEILTNDLLTYGKKNKTVAEYDKKEIAKYKLKIEHLRRN